MLLILMRAPSEHSSVHVPFGIRLTLTPVRRANHRDTLAFNLDASDFLHSAKDGTTPDDLCGKPLPNKQQVDVVCAGVPCQGHTSLNMHRTADDPKNCQILTALSFVEHYRPKFFVLENVGRLCEFRLLSLMCHWQVVHIVNWQLMARDRGQGRIRGGVEYGGLRLVLSILLELG